jgi:lysophospholipase L1-like esterase
MRAAPRHATLTVMTLPRSHTRLLALGDSYTIGEGVAPDARWPNLVARALDLGPPTIVATTGWTVAELLTGMEHAGVWPATATPRGRDAAHRRQTTSTAVSPPSSRSRSMRIAFERACALAGGEPARVVGVSIPDWGVTPFAEGRDRDRIARELDALNESERTFLRSRGAHWVDVTVRSREHGADRAFLADDGLHPGPAAYAAWADAITPAVRAALAGRGPDEV